ncbi:hypothetical protein Droror1_Dr00019796 [Drosera rotundifolia]
MVTTLMSTTKPLTTTTTLLSTPKSIIPKIPLLALPPLPFLKPLKFTTTLTAAAAPLLVPLPALAEEFEKAQLFDFDLTLPIIAAEFLLLMFALDKIYYTPLGDFMDARDAAIKAKLEAVKDNSEEIKALEDQANAVMRAARAEIASALNKMRKETAEEVEKLLQEGKRRMEAELEEALEALEMERDETVLALEKQIVQLEEEIVKKVLPVS